MKRLASQNSQLSRELSRVEQQEGRKRETAAHRDKADRLLAQRTAELEEKERALE